MSALLAITCALAAQQASALLRSRPARPCTALGSLLDSLGDKASSCYDVSMEKFNSGSDYQSNAKAQMGTWMDSSKLDELRELYNDIIIDSRSRPFKALVAAYDRSIEAKKRGGDDSPSIITVQLLGQPQKFSLNLYLVPTGQQLPPRRHDPGTVLLYRILRGSGRLKSIVSSRVIQDDLLEALPLYLQYGSKNDRATEDSRAAARALSRIGGPVRVFSAQAPSYAKYGLEGGGEGEADFDGAALCELEVYPPDHLRSDQGSGGDGFYLDSDDGIFDNQPYGRGQVLYRLEPGGIAHLEELLASASQTISSSSSSKAKASTKRSAPSGADVGTSLRTSVGGLSTEIDAIVRRVLSSRSMPPAVMAALGLQHVRGLLLHGPPGTGKTLVARHIAAALNAREPKIVNGPELLDKFVGEAERRVRELFAEAEDEWRLLGARSQLHVIVFDEFDAIAKRRGSLSSDGSGVRDSVVNQILSKMDGMQPTNNVLVIALTNRKELIDSALLRPGRLEVHVEIKAPTVVGRVEILFILLRPLIACGVVDSAEAPSLALRVARATHGRTGADLAGVVRSAASFALQRHCSTAGEGALDEGSIMAGLRLRSDDFQRALRETGAAAGPLRALRARLEVGLGGAALQEALLSFATVQAAPFSAAEEEEEESAEAGEERPWGNLGGSLIF